MTSCGNGTKSSTGFLTYENPTYGIKMQYPSDWIKNTTISKPDDRTTQSFDTPSAESLKVAIVKLNKPNYTLKQFLDEEIQLNVNGYTYRLEEHGTNATLANQPAYYLIYTKIVNGSKVEEVGTVIGVKAYILTYSANTYRYCTYLADADRMINSFDIANQTQGPSSTNTTVLTQAIT